MFFPGRVGDHFALTSEERRLGEKAAERKVCQRRFLCRDWAEAGAASSALTKRNAEGLAARPQDNANSRSLVGEKCLARDDNLKQERNPAEAIVAVGVRSGGERPVQRQNPYPSQNEESGTRKR
jgi:hypothetical protein